MPQIHRDTGIAVATIVLSLLTLFLWIPLDIESGVVETHRRTQYIGDAMLPMVCAVLFLLCGVVLLAQCILRRRGIEYNVASSTDSDAQYPADILPGIRYYLGLFLVLLLSLLLMYYIGVLVLQVASALNIETASYRELRDTVPWKYSGFLVGGTFMVTGLIVLIEQRWRWKNLIIGLITCAVLIILFDLPFEDLLLPPNGDY